MSAGSPQGAARRRLAEVLSAPGVMFTPAGGWRIWRLGDVFIRGDEGTQQGSSSSPPRLANTEDVCGACSPRALALSLAFVRALRTSPRSQRLLEPTELSGKS